MKTANNHMDRQFEEAVGSLFKLIGSVIAALFKGLFYGMKKLNKKQTWIGLGITFFVFLVGIGCRDKIMALDMPVYIKWLLYLTALGAPVLYLFLLGNVQGNSQKKYEKIFKDIGFVGKDGKYPYLCGIKKEGKKQILIFKSNIPLADWKAAKGRLETALDYNILKIEYGNSKKIVKVTVLPADFKIPELITWDDIFLRIKDGMITIGKSALEDISFDLNRVPHVLVAGETGSGKSVILRCILWQMILKGSRVYMIDFKGGVEFGKQYEKYGEVITERERAAEVLEMLVKENEKRLRIFRELEVKNLYEYNKKTHQNLCRIGVFSDELAEMLDKRGVAKENRVIYQEIEGKMSTLARLSRATGINLFLGVQRPDANVLTGQIKNNIPVRVSGRFADKTASEIVLGNTDAVDLPDIKGRFLYKVGNETIEFQSFYFDDDKMLHDVNVEVGNMLTEAKSTVAKKEIKAVNQEIKIEKKAKKPAKPSKINMAVVDNDEGDLFCDEELPFPLDDSDIVLDSGFEPEKSLENMTLEEMDAYDLNLNFWEDVKK